MCRIARMVALLFAVAGNARADTCGQPVSSGSEPIVSDALFVLKTALKTRKCDLCTCDVDSSGTITATDARRVLLRTVGTEVPFYCPLCPGDLEGCHGTSDASVPCEVTFSIVNAVGLLGAVQFNVHSDANGFDDARCGPRVPTALGTFNVTGNGTLAAGLIDIEGFPTPTHLVSCTFRTRDSVDVDDFQLTLVDATAPDLHSPDPPPILQITELEALF